MTIYSDHLKEITNLTVGLDIGTSSISAAVLDLTNEKQLETYTVANNSKIHSDNSAFHLQDPDVIFDSIINLIEEIIDKHTNDHSTIRCIGVTGQMHGILYVDKNGDAISPLMTWQDKRADLPCDGNMTYCEKIHSITGENISAGYGLATHYYNTLNNLVPASACCLCSIMDYVVMRLTGRSKPIMHTSVAASFGLFDVQKGDFKHDTITKLNIEEDILPRVTDEYFVCGSFKDIDVAVAIGDNQASFLGAVDDLDDSILVNIGTGSQVSAVTTSFDVSNGLEIRPLVKNKFLVCGSALYGGASYALLENFFLQYIAYANPNAEIASQYDIVNKLAQDAYDKKLPPLQVNTCFIGKRNAPNERGAILNISRDNFTPGQLALGFIVGMCNELREMFAGNVEGKTKLIASGNAVQKIPIMKNVIEDCFGMPVEILSKKEEASTGAALFAAASARLIDTFYIYHY